MVISNTVTTNGHIHAQPWDSGFLQVSELHKIYYEQYGVKTGKAVVFLHGGPGGSMSYAHTAFFDPEVYRVVLFDQRGAGRSLPSAELEENTSQHLVADIEALRMALGIQKWAMVFGGSWGSTLSLLYAQTYPGSVCSLVLRGIFTERKDELQFSRGCTGAARLFPEAYQAFINYLHPSIRHDPIAGYYQLVTSEDPETRLAASRSWNRWDMTMTKLIPEEDAMVGKTDLWCLQHARLETHYAVHGGFLEEGQLLKAENLAKISHIPCTIINGRYDMFCPPQTAWELHQSLSGSRLFIVPDAGHSADEPGIRCKLIEVCDEYARL